MEGVRSTETSEGDPPVDTDSGSSAEDERAEDSPAQAPITPELVESEQADVWRQARASRWYHRTWVRLLLVVALFVGVLAVVPWPLYVTADCVIIPSERAYVRSPIAGVIAEILVDEGTQVKKGDVIARLDDRHLVAEREKAVADEEELGIKVKRVSHLPAIEFAQRELNRLNRF